MAEVAERLLHGQDSFPVLSETGERGTSDNGGTDEKETEKGKKKGKGWRPFLVYSLYFIITYSVLFVKC